VATAVVGAACACVTSVCLRAYCGWRACVPRACNACVRTYDVRARRPAPRTEVQNDCAAGYPRVCFDAPSPLRLYRDFYVLTRGQDFPWKSQS